VKFTRWNRDLQSSKDKGVNGSINSKKVKELLENLKLKLYIIALRRLDYNNQSFIFKANSNNDNHKKLLSKR